MLIHCSQQRTGKIVIQQHRHSLWLKYIRTFIREKCEQLYSSSVYRSCEGTDKYPVHSCCVALKYLVCSQRFKNVTDIFHKSLDTSVRSFASEPHFRFRPVVLKLCIYPHADRNFLMQARHLQHRMFSTDVHLCIRSFNFCMSEQNLAEGMVSKKDLPEGTVTDKNLMEIIATEQTACATTTADEKELSENDLKILARLLHCSVDMMKNLATRYSFFRHLSLELIKLKVTILTHYGLPYSFVSQNPRLLYQTSAYQLHKRLEKLKAQSFLSENSVVTLESLPHYLECRNNYFPYAFKILCAEKDALEGCRDQLAYLQFRLKCSKELSHQILTSYPLERHISNVKLKEMLDFFLNEAQVSSQFVIDHRRLMAFSIRRLQMRLKVMRSEGIESENMMFNIWNMTQKQFDQEYGDSK